jgi:hypothetical protein
LTIKQPTASEITESVCKSYVFNGTTLTTSGIYKDTLTNVAGCDSVITLNLTIKQPTASEITESVCKSYVFNGTTLTTSGIYKDTLTNVAGCDSVITLNLTIKQPTASSVTVSNCRPYTWPVSGLTYNVSGAYKDTLQNVAGCDSVITLNLTIKQPTASSVTVSNCGPYTWPVSGLTYNVSGMYKDTLTNVAGCDSVITLNLTINIAPTITLIASEDTLTCVKTSSILSATGGVSYEWKKAGITVGTDDSLTVTTIGRYILIVTGTGGCTKTDSIEIFEDKVLPTITITGDFALSCTTNTARLIANGGVSYEWRNIIGGPALSINDTLNISMGGQYTVTGTGSNGCVSTAQRFIMTNFPTPPSFIQTNGTELTCLKDTIKIQVISASPSMSITLVGPNGVVSPDFGGLPPIPPFKYNLTVPGVYTATVPPTGPGMCGGTSTITITQDTLKPTVTLTTTKDTLTCSTPNATLTATSGGTYLWSTGATTSTISVSTMGTYKVTVTGTNGCSKMDSVVIKENKILPTINVTTTEDTLTCTTPTATLTATGGVTYGWEKGNVLVGTNATLTVSSPGTYKVFVIGTNGCSKTDSIVIKENKILPITSVITSKDTLTCAILNATLTATGGGTYLWSTGATTSTISVSTSGNYKVTVTGTNGCIKMDSIIIFENKVLPTITVTGSATVCTGETLNLTAEGGGTYAWTGPNAFNETTAAISLPFAVIAYSGTYTVTVTSTNGCTANATTLVTVNAVPITPTVQASINIPAGTDITLTATGCAGTLLWFNAADNSSVTMPISPTATTTYYAKCAVTANSVTCIGQASGNVIVTVGPLEIISIKTGDWEDPTTWNVGRLPLVTEDVTIDTSHIVTVTTPTQATAKKLIYKTGSTLNFGNTTAKLTLGSL